MVFHPRPDRRHGTAGGGRHIAVADTDHRALAARRQGQRRREIANHQIGPGQVEQAAPTIDPSGQSLVVGKANNLQDVSETMGRDLP